MAFVDERSNTIEQIQSGNPEALFASAKSTIEDSAQNMRREDGSKMSIPEAQVGMSSKILRQILKFKGLLDSEIEELVKFFESALNGLPERVEP